jgi:hypothetical protein
MENVDWLKELVFENRTITAKLLTALKVSNHTL